MGRYLLGAWALVAASLVAAQETKWHPGHYVMLNGKGPVDQHMWQIDELRNDASIQGFMVRFSWYELEPAQDMYDFSSIDAYLEKLRNTNTTKRLVLRVLDRAFLTDDDSNLVPDYLLEEAVYNGGLVRSSTGYVARLWEEPVMSRLISLYEAIGRRYDSDPLFEGAFTEETTLSFPYPDFPPGYSHELLAEQYVRFMSAVKATMPTSNLFFNANWIGSTTIMSDLIQEIRNAGVAAGGSNVIPGRPTQGQQVLVGVHGADYRLELPIANGVESGELGDFTPGEIGTYAYEELQAHYLFWIRKTWGSAPEQRWYTGILPYLRSEPQIRTRCPNVYGVCVTDDPRPPPRNRPPVVSAGPDTSMRLPDNSIVLAGSVTDDGLPMALPSIEWTQVAGPEPSTFADVTSPTSQATFFVAGTYVLRLTASDGEFATEDEVTVTVSPEPPSPPAEEDSGGGDAGAVLAPAVGASSGGGRFDLLEPVLLGALFAYSRFATRMRSPPGAANP